MESLLNPDPFIYSGRKVGLVPANEKHFGFIHEVRSQVEIAPLWQGRRRFPPQSEYSRFLENLAHNIFIVVKKSEGCRPIGFIYDYDHNPEDQYTFIASAMLHADMEKGFGAEANWLLLNWLYETYPLRKVYSDIYGYNQLSLSTVKTAGFKEEGCFTEHRFWKGRFWNMYRLAMSAKDWEVTRQKYAKVFGRPLQVEPAKENKEVVLELS
ncbi:MAG: hypothetical protein JWP00_4090 [Chloroflexi bacterium]|jgi:RimJ/RimL family protein N-acetyltransferase|nr:hypothetical protein [Chloroflexota bacterium]